jgi:Ca2+-binding RTX toxin-like protein
MVAFIRSDLDFILKQIKIAEAHSLHLANPLDPNGKPLFGPNGSIPAYNISWGLRTVDGSYNHLLPGRENWGAADQPFPELLTPTYRPAQGGMLDPDGPGPAPSFPTQPNYNPSNNPNSVVIDSSLRTISNLIVDQTLDNPAAIMMALKRAGAAEGTELQTAMAIKTEYATVKPFLETAEAAELANINAQRTLVARQQAYSTDPTAANEAALAEAQTAADNAQTAATSANALLATERVELDTMLALNGIEMDGDNIALPNAAPDEGLSASFNSWFTLFGQFFDHGLDLVAKGNSGTVFIPLQPDDPLYDPSSPTNFMVLTRATVGPGTDGVTGTADDTRPLNSTTSFVDQNQTYTSHPSHQVFLREYVLVNGRPEATGNLLDGVNGGLPTWGEIKAQARNVLGIDLTDYHVGNLPLLATDPYGNFIPGPNGFPQVVMAGPPQMLASGTPGSPLSLVNVSPDGPDTNTLPDVTHLAVRTGHAFLDDIAHTAAPTGKLADGDIEVGLGNLDPNAFYDQALLDAHFVTGDGRGNENIGLTAVHHVFHAEHNRLMQHTKDTVLESGDLGFINEWLDVPVASIPITPEAKAALDWNGERLFQAAKFGTEMQYQHLVFEEFARKIQPNINVFLVPDGFDATLNPTIVAEFAHVVYRFGHSMLTETIDRFNPGFEDDTVGLIEGFLNPIEFASQGSEEMAGAIVRGMTRQVGNEIDEFVTSALRNNLLGLPLDLATINLARGRDTGVPSLNAARRDFYQAANNDTFLKPYESWADFAGNLKNEASIINFVAAYGTHSLITSQTTVEGKRDAALTIITGESFGGLTAPADRLDFLNATGAYAGGSLGGLENIDLWIGGLAEKTMPFGGMLGSTFNFVFEGMMESLQSGDRFYYLQRLDGLHLFGEMENNSFASMIMRNTDATHLPSDVFSTPGLILEVDQTKQFNDLDGDGDLETTDPTGGGLLTKVVTRDNPTTPGVDLNYLRYSGEEHVVLGGTAASDTLIASIGDDALYGDAGNDIMEGGFGNDVLNGGAGDDIIRDMGGDDNIKAGDGNDVVHAGPGLDLVMGGKGQDFIFLGTDMGSEVFAGEGNDFIYGNRNAERILGNEGNDWIETGTFDGAPGDNFDEVFAHDEVEGHDVFLGDGGFDEFIGEGGDDIMVGSAGRGKMVGMSGFDWATYKDNVFAVNADLSIPIIFDEAPTLPQNAALDEYESVEGLSGSKFNDTLKGSETIAEERLPAAQGGSEGFRGSQLTKEGVQLITGLAQVLGLTTAQVNAMATGQVVFNAGDIILGGDGSDMIQGNGGDDIIDGDKWLNVRISVRANIDGTGSEIESHNSMTTLANKMFSGQINPGQLVIVREILSDTTTGDVDTAAYRGLRTEYAFSATADGQVVITHTAEDGIDGSDKLRGIEKVQFADGGALNIIVGTPFNDNGAAPQGPPSANRPVLNGTAGDDLIIGLAGSDVLNGNNGNDILVGGSGVDTLNGGIGDDTYSFTVGDGVDVINETGGVSDRISISGALASIAINEETNDDLVIALNGGSDRITVVDHFDQTSEGAEFVNFNGATLNGYLLEGDYALSTDDVGVRTAAVPLQNTVLAGTTGEDVLVGNTGNDLLFGHSDDDNLQGGDGDDLLVGGTGNDDLDAARNVGGDDLAGALGADVMIGGAGNDTYGVDDLLDSVVEIANEGTDTVETFMAALSIETMANVENLSYVGVDADQFVGTGNSLNNIISAGDLADTLSGLGGADTLNGGLGNDTLNGGDGNDTLNGGGDVDTMVGGAGNDTYVVDNASDVVNESTGLPADVDIVQASITYTLAAGVENLTLTGGAAINGTGNAANNIIAGNGADNQLFGGSGNDSLAGNSGNDVLDGGTGDDTLNGGDLNDTVIGGEGNDTIDVGTGFNRLVYNATSFGADVVNSFDSSGGTAATQDLIDLRALGVTAANFDTRVVETAQGGNTLLTIRDGNLNPMGTILINGSNAAAIDSSDFLLAEAPPPTFGSPTNAANTITGNAAANTITGLGGNDTLSGAGGNDVINGGEGADALDGGDGDDTLSGGIGSDVGAMADNFDTVSYGNNTGTATFAGNWTEAGGETTAANTGDIRIDGGRLAFVAGIDGGETIERAINLAGASSATLSFNYEADDLDAGEQVVVEAFNGAWVTLGTLGGDTDGTANFSAPLTAAHTAIRFRAVGSFETGAFGTSENFYVDNLAITYTAPGLNAGADTISGGTGDDTIIWNANASSPTDGRDVVDGGTENATGDTFVISGNASPEAYTIYTRAAWLGVAGNLPGSLNAATEIVVTRNGSNNTAVIAELREIEEIRINGVDPAGAIGGAGAGDTFQVVGDFSSTSLRLNTITIDGDAGNDTIDISSLSSAHRIVFKSNGGNDTIVGTMRPQDVIELPEGATESDYERTTAANGVTTISNGVHAISFTSAGGMPQIGNGGDEDDDHGEDPIDNDEDTSSDDGDDEHSCDGNGADDSEDDEAGTPAPQPGTSLGATITGTTSNNVLIGTVKSETILALDGDDSVVAGDGADVLDGSFGDDFLSGQGGRDVAFGGQGNDTILGGSDSDMLYGDAGRDRIFGDEGHDLIDAGSEADTVYGGSGDDMIVASVSDGNDTYYGDGMAGGTGSDTLDMASITANVTADLGTGLLNRGSVSSDQTGSDTLWGVENIVTGSGNDAITASRAVNVIDGGKGNDTFRFLSAGDADGDTILGFQPGDRLDLSAIDASSAAGSQQAFTLANGSSGAVAQVVITHETRDDGDYTIVSGNTGGTDAAEFRISIKGTHELDGNNFVF